MVGWLLLSYAAAGIGGLASVDAGTFYASLMLPRWAPPAWLFGPVWLVLYGMMGVAAWLVWRAGDAASRRHALVLFVAQLLANALWSWLFFRWRLGGLAFVDIVVLWVLVLATTRAFWRINTVAGAMMIPYALWISFAAALNYVAWRGNAWALG